MAQAVQASDNEKKDDGNVGVYGFESVDIDGKKVLLGKYKGNFLLICNVASLWGYTESNYKFFQALYEKFKDAGLSIAVYPCNQFADEEPWPEHQIKKWLKDNFSISFDIYSKVNVVGKDIDPLFEYLVGCNTNNKQPIRWNFDGKWLIGKDGQCQKRWNNKDSLQSIEAYIVDQIKGGK